MEADQRFPDFFWLISNVGTPIGDVDLSRPGEPLLRSLEGPPSGADVISPTNYLPSGYLT